MEKEIVNIKTIQYRLRTCAMLTKACGVEMQPETECKDLPCFKVCPLQKMTPEGRRCERANLSIPIKYGRTKKCDAIMVDLSLGGMGIETDKLFADGTKVHIQIPNRKKCIAEATVIWTHENRTGVKFTKATKSFKTFLLETLLS